MPVNPRGFSLVEALVAAAILLLATAGVTGVVTASLRAERTETIQQQLEQRVRTELARLSALPYVAPAPAPAPEPQGYDPAQARSLLQAVFPHALEAQNTLPAFFSPASSSEPCTFTTVTEAAWGSLRVTCCFVSATAGEWRPMVATDVEGWAVWLDVVPPSAAVRVTIAAVEEGSGAHRAEVSAVLDALRPRIAEPVS